MALPASGSNTRCTVMSSPMRGATRSSAPATSWLRSATVVVSGCSRLKDSSLAVSAEALAQALRISRSAPATNVASGASRS